MDNRDDLVKLRRWADHILGGPGSMPTDKEARDEIGSRIKKMREELVQCQVQQIKGAMADEIFGSTPVVNAWIPVMDRVVRTDGGTRRALVYRAREQDGRVVGDEWFETITTIQTDWNQPVPVAIATTSRILPGMEDTAPALHAVLANDPTMTEAG